MKVLEEDLHMVISTGRDKRGIIASISMAMFNAGYNIVDAKQSVIHGQFLLIFIIEPTERLVDNPTGFLEQRFDEITAGTDIKISVQRFRGGLRTNVRQHARVAWFGRDRSGMIAAISNLMGKNNINIEGTNMTARGELISCEFRLDISNSYATMPELRKDLDELGKTFEIDFLLQAPGYQEEQKKLLIFDMVPVLKYDHIDKIVRAFPRDLKLSEFENLHQKIGEAVENLKGLPLETLNELVACINITPETIELVRSVQSMNFKIALISQGISQFSDYIGEILHLDYTFGSRLNVEDGILTGELDAEAFVDDKKKEQLVNWLATLERISMEEVEDFGEVSRHLNYDIEKAEFGIAFTLDASKIFNLLKSGKITMEQFKAFIAAFSSF